MLFRAVRSFAAAAAVLSVVGGTATAQAAGPKLRNNYLAAVAVAPGGTAWAVGDYNTGSFVTKTLVERWNGAAWRIVPSPAIGGPAEPNYLVGVVATGSSSAWAVGFVRTATSDQTLILRWNGTSWRRVASPSPGGSAGESHLAAVTAISPSSAWAVGNYTSGTSGVVKTLILRWNGRSWKQVPSPSPNGSGQNYLAGVVALSRSSAWAVGNYFQGRSRRTLAVRWNGKTWKQVPSPNPGGTANDSSFSAVTAASPSSVWAVGDYDNGTKLLTLIERWNGKAWKRVASPNGPSTTNLLDGVAAATPSAALAVGYYGNGVTSLALTEHWNGRSWKQVSCPSPSGIFGISLLNAVAATSAASAWAVGYYNGSAARTLIVRWNGKAWKRVPSPNR